MRFLIKFFLICSVFHLAMLPAQAKSDVLPVLGARYRFYLADPVDLAELKEMGVNATYEFGHNLGQTENELLKSKMPQQRITLQIQLTKDLKIIALNKTQNIPDDGRFDNAVYILNKNQVVGYLIMEAIFAPMKYPEQLLGPIRQMSLNTNYLGQILGNTVQAQQTGLTVYETTHHGFIERYFLDSNSTIGIEGFYPMELDATLRPYVVRYIQDYYLSN